MRLCSVASQVNAFLLHKQTVSSEPDRVPNGGQKSQGKATADEQICALQIQADAILPTIVRGNLRLGICKSVVLDDLEEQKHISVLTWSVGSLSFACGSDDISPCWQTLLSGALTCCRRDTLFTNTLKVHKKSLDFVSTLVSSVILNISHRDIVDRWQCQVLLPSARMEPIKRLEVESHQSVIIGPILLVFHM